jgi:HK97 gp10 family phage protein
LVSITGIAKTKAALARVRLEMEAATPIAEKASAEIIAKAAIARAPVDTGQLVQSIHVDDSGTGANAVADVPYAPFPEYGTRYMPGQHYMAQAAEDSKLGIVATMLAIYRAAIH